MPLHNWISKNRSWISNFLPLDLVDSPVTGNVLSGNMKTTSYHYPNAISSLHFLITFLLALKEISYSAMHYHHIYHRIFNFTHRVYNSIIKLLTPKWTKITKGRKDKKLKTSEFKNRGRYGNKWKRTLREARASYRILVRGEEDGERGWRMIGGWRMDQDSERGWWDGGRGS